MIRSIHLHGGLGRRFGPRFDLAVDTPAEAIRALCGILRGFREAVANASWRVVRGRVGLEPEALGLRFGACRELHIVPAPAGRKNSGVGKIVLGVVLVAAAVVTAGMALAAAPAGAGVLGTAMSAGAVAGTSAIGVSGVLTVGQLAFMGFGMILAGASSLLSQQTRGQSAAVEQNPSFIFSGPVNTSSQGGPVPLVYGKVRVGSVVAAAALKSEDYIANSQVSSMSVLQRGKLMAIEAART